MKPPPTSKSIIVHCPVCGRAVDWHTNPDRPFCSPRCRLIDLGKWAGGEYRIPCEDPPDNGEEAINPPSEES